MVEWGFRDGILILEFRREVDAVVLTDIPDRLRRELLRLGRDAHGIEDMTTSRQVATKGSRRDIGQLGQGALGDETVLIVKVDHTIFFEVKC